MQWLMYLYRRLRNRDRLDDAQRRERIALRMAAMAQEAATASASQLAVCRGLLATVMGERDDYQTAVDALALQLAAVKEELASLREERFQEHQQMRFWITRTVSPQKGSWN